MLSAEIQKTLSRCKKDDKSDEEVICHALNHFSALAIYTKAADDLDLKLSMPELDQRLNIIRKMIGAEFSEVKATACAKALFVDQSTDSLDAAFQCFVKESETQVSLDDFKKLMPLMVEDFPQEKLDDLVKEVDADGSGQIDSKEFGRLLLGLSGKQPFSFGVSMFKMPALAMPKMPEMPKMEMPDMPKMPWSKQDGAGTEEDAKTEEQPATEGEAKEEEKASTKPWFDPGESVSGFMSAYNAGLPDLGPVEMVKVGKIMNRMTFAGFTPEKSQIVCKALFCPVEEEDMRKAYDLFDTEGDGVLSATEFTAMMPLLGEEMPDEKVAETLKKVDKDGSGQLEFDEFATLISLLNPKQGPPPLGVGDQVRVLGGVSLKKSGKDLYKEGDIGEIVKTFPWGDDVTLEIKWQRSGVTTSTKRSQLKGKFDKVKGTGAEKASA